MGQYGHWVLGYTKHIRNICGFGGLQVGLVRLVGVDGVVGVVDVVDVVANVGTNIAAFATAIAKRHCYLEYPLVEYHEPHRLPIHP
jgi:hypothetical protein